jgi:hypothetical protein
MQLRAFDVERRSAFDGHERRQFDRDEPGLLDQCIGFDNGICRVVYVGCRTTQRCAEREHRRNDAGDVACDQHIVRRTETPRHQYFEDFTQI